MFEGFGATGELAFGEIKAADSLATEGFIQNAITLDGVEGFEFLVELYPYQRSE